MGVGLRKPENPHMLGNQHYNSIRAMGQRKITREIKGIFKLMKIKILHIKISQVLIADRM